MKKRLLVSSFILFLLSFFFYLWFKESTTPVTPLALESKIFVVNQGESVREIAKKLKNENLIRDSLAFFILVKRLGVEKNIQAGDFRLNPSMSAYEILDELQHGTLDIWVTIPEGWRREEVGLKLAKELDIPEQEFNKYSREGYLFPDTYLIPKGATASAVVKMMEANFEKKVSQSLSVEGMNLNEIITIASLIEKEAKYTEDRPLVASVILNRLAQGMKLDIDATVQYALGYQPNEKSWWKKNLTKNDLQYISPYNTYINNSLPPAPISNPGIAAIKAVLNPAKTEYFYYISDKEGRLHFAKDLESQQKNINQYLRY